MQYLAIFLLQSQNFGKSGEGFDNLLRHDLQKFKPQFETCELPKHCDVNTPFCD